VGNWRGAGEDDGGVRKLSFHRFETRAEILQTRPPCRVLPAEPAEVASQELKGEVVACLFRLKLRQPPPEFGELEFESFALRRGRRKCR